MPFRLANLLDILLATAIIGAAFFYFAHAPINHDVGWFMYAAKGMLAGGTLYQDYIDVNAPLAYWMLLPAAALARLSFLSNEAALALSILTYIAIAYGLCVAVTRYMEMTPRSRTALRGALLIIMCFLPFYAFGQREHVLAVLTIPYVLAAGLRDRSRPRGLAIVCAIAAGLGASIKLPYLLVPAAVEAAIVVRRGWRIKLDADLLALGGTIIAAYLISYFAYPDYWTSILPRTLKLYDAYMNFQFLSDALMILMPLYFVATLLGNYQGKSAIAVARIACLAAIAGALAMFILQRKGWPHQALPVVMLTCTLIALNLTDIAARAKTDILRGGLGLVLLVATFWVTATHGLVNLPMMQNLDELIRVTDGSFYIISTGNYPAFPLALNPHYKWASRFPQLIMLPGLIEADLKGQPSPEAPWFRQAVLEDLQRAKPAIVFLYMPIDAGGFDGPTMLDWFMRDPAFAAEWQNHYRQDGDTPPYIVFERIKSSE